MKEDLDRLRGPSLTEGIDQEGNFMHVFVTGASGHIGSAVVDELLGAGHQVTGLARSDTSAAALTKKGATVHRGDLADLDGLGSAAGAADGVIHLAYRDDFDSDFVGAAETDLRVVTAMGEVLAGSDRPLVNTSGTLLLAGGGPGRDAPGKKAPGEG